LIIINYLKTQIKHPFFKKYRCEKIIPTLNKTHISIVYAIISMLSEAYANKVNTHFLFLCQSSIPLFPFNELKKIILNSDKSLIKIFNNNCVHRYHQLSNNFL
jgi:hypothetical protein